MYSSWLRKLCALGESFAKVNGVPSDGIGVSGAIVDWREDESSKLEVDAREPNGREMGGGRLLLPF